MPPARPLRVLIVADDLYPGFGGQAASTEGFIRMLRERGHRVTCITARVPTPTEPRGVRVFRFASWQPGDKMTRFVFPDARALHRLVAANDLVHVMTPTPLSWTALGYARRLKKPALVGFHTQRESLTSHVAPEVRRAVSDALDAYYRRFYARADVALCPSNFAAQVYREYSDGPAEVISNGVDLTVFDPARVPDAAVRAFREGLGLREGQRLILSVGRLSHEKDPLALLRVAQELAALRQDFVLAFGGTGPLARDLEAGIEAGGLGERVKRLGFVPDTDLPLAYRAADLFALASPTELQGIVLLEAMAMGAALFVADVPTSAATEALNGGRTGLSFDPRDPKGAARVLSNLFDEPARLDLLRRNAREDIAAHDLRASGRKLEAIYLKALSGAYPPRPAPSRRAALRKEHA
ncbi:MAG TPA: glycosyltransferase [Deinococcales bacterium]|nr:glycosyltransferase [Deinococcales bacterium]